MPKLLPRVDQWTPGIRPTWNVAQVKAALYSHQTGSMAESSLLVEAMYADDELPSALEAAVDEIVGSTFSLDAVEDKDGEPDPESERYADALREHWHDCFPEHELANLVRWFIMLGVAVGTLDWERRDNVWLPRLRTLHPQYLYWDEGTPDPQTGRMGVWRYHARDDTHIVTPGDGRWVLLSDGRESWMRSSVRALATTWLVKQYTWRDWARYNERHGLPILLGKIPTFAEDKDEFLSDLKRLGSETVAILPQMADEDGPSYGLDLLEAKDQSWDTFRATIERCDRKFQVHFQGTNTTELIGTAGSRATSESGRSISSQRAAQRERRLTTDFRDQLVKPWVGYNIKGADMSLAPWPHWAVEGEEDTLRRAESLERFASFLTHIKAAGYEVANIEEEAARYGLTLKEREVESGAGPVDETDSGGGVDTDDGGDGKGAAEELAQDVGKRDGFQAGQAYLDGLVGSLTAEADALESVSAEEMVSIIDAAKDPDDLRQRLLDHIGSDDPYMLAAVFEKAILLASLAGRFAVQEDL